MRIPFTGIDIGVKRSASSKEKSWSPTDERWYTPWPWIGVNGTKTVTPQSAQGTSAVYSGVKIISETIGSIPFPLYQRKGDGKREKAESNSLYHVLKDLANPNLTAMEFREMMTAHMILRGNAFAQIIRGGDNQVVQLHPLNPDKMTLVYDKDLKEYTYEYSVNGVQKKLLREQVFHLRGPSDDGLWGKSFVAVLRDLIGQNLTLDEYCNNFYTNNAAPSGVLQMAAGMEMTPKAKDNLREEWKKKYQGSNKSGSVAILEEGLEWKQIGMSSQDSQFIDTLKDARRQILGCLRVPLYMAGDPEKLSFNTIEQLSIQFITYTMMPYFVRWEQTVHRDLLTEQERKKYFVEFLVDGLQRGDIVSRYRAYAVGRQWGWLSVNDIRKYENMDSIEGGDVYLQPLNMIDSKEASEYLLSDDGSSEEEPPGTKNETDDNSNITLKNTKLQLDLIKRQKKEENLDFDFIFEELTKISQKVDKIVEKEQKSAKNEEKPSKNLESQIELLSQANVQVTSEILARAMRKENAAVATATRKGKLDTIEVDFYADHVNFIRESLRPAVKSNLEQIFIVSRGFRAGYLEGEVEEVVNMAVSRYLDSFKNIDKDSIEAKAIDLAYEIAEAVKTKGLRIARG